jgi:hypothetical protein
MKNQNTPYLHCKVRNEFLGLTNPGFTECYIFLVTALPNRPLLFTCHTEHGGVFSRLPIWAFVPLSADTTEPPDETAQRWSVLGSSIEVVQPSYLKDYRTQTKFGEGVYKFSIDFVEGLYSEDPEQHKMLHLIELGNKFVLVPNNEVRFLDSHFVSDITIKYQRNTKYFYTKE